MVAMTAIVRGRSARRIRGLVSVLAHRGDEPHGRRHPLGLAHVAPRSYNGGGGGATRGAQVTGNPQQPPRPRAAEGQKSFVGTLLLSYFLGFFGVDRFYLGKTGSGLAKLLTFGGFGYWWVFDVLLTLFGGQRDAAGLRLAGYARHRKTVWIVIGALAGSIVLAGVVPALLIAVLDPRAAAVSGWMLLTVAVAAAAAGAAVWLRSGVRRRRLVRAARRADPVPERVRARIDQLGALRPRYLARAADGDEVAAAVVDGVDSLAVNVSELFARLRVKSDGPQRSLAEIEYDDKLGKLAGALGPDYLLDVLANPRLWESPHAHVRDVQGALEAVDAQLVGNIRQVNAQRALVFEVALDRLIGPRKAIDDWQRDFDRASGVERV